MTKKRTQGTEAESFVRRSGKKGAAKVTSFSDERPLCVRKWRQFCISELLSNETQSESPQNMHYIPIYCKGEKARTLLPMKCNFIFSPRISDRL